MEVLYIFVQKTFCLNKYDNFTILKLIEPAEILPCEYGVISVDNDCTHGRQSYGSISWQINDQNNLPLTPGYGKNEKGRRLNIAYQTGFQ